MSALTSRSIIKWVVALVSLSILSFYAYFQAQSLLQGPKLEITSPQNGATIASSSPEIVVKGSAHNISFITINGLQIFTDEGGDFARTLLLSPGYNIITIEVQDKFKRSISKQLQLVVK